MSDLGTTAFDNSEKIDILIKENFNVSSTNENTPWYLENNATFNTYVNGKDILLDEIPNSVNWSSSSFLTASELSSIYGLTSNDFYSGGGVKVDSTGVLHKFIKLKLQPIPGTNITSVSTTTYFSYYHKNSNGINLLENSFQLNHGDGSSFAYSMYSNAGIANNVSILQDSNGGNWFFNFKNGIVFIPDPTKNSTMLSNVNQNNLPYFTFVKYVGRKGIAKQISVVQNKTTITNPENNQIVVQTSDNTLHRYDTSTTSWISIGGSGGGGGSTTITSLNDVSDVTYPSGGITNGYVLKWNSTSSKWEPSADSQGTTINLLKDIGNVNISSLNTGDVLKWNGNNWVNSTDLQGTGSGGTTLQPSTGILNNFTEAQVLEKMTSLINSGTVKNSSGQIKTLSSSENSTIPFSSDDSGDNWHVINIFEDGIGIKPPSGTKQVKLSYTAYLSFNNDNEIFDKDALLEWIWVINGTKIINSKNIVHLDLVEKYSTIETTITIDETFQNDDLANNKLKTWTDDKEIKIYARSKDETQLVKIHKQKPSIDITSIGKGSSITSLNNISDVSFNINDLSEGNILMWSATTNKWEAKENQGGSGGGGGSGNGVTVIPSSASVDLSENILYPTANTGSGKEGDIIYDASENLFYEASNSKTDTTGNGEIAFRPLGYSFFAKNMEGQAPNIQSTSFFFFELTPSSIILHWRNPIQYETGITASPSQPLNETSPIVNEPSGGIGGTINFPIINRIMLQIKNLKTSEYITWGDKRSPISKHISGLSGGYVICSKDYPIPPMSINKNFGNILSDGGRSNSIYKMQDFADSIILFSEGNTPTNDIIKSGVASYPKRIFPVSGENNKELNPSEQGYEIKFWYENEYKKNPNSTFEDGWGMNDNDFNVITLNQAKDQSGNLILDNGKINFLTVLPPTQPQDAISSIAFNNLGNVSNSSTLIEIKLKDPLKTTDTDIQYNNTINLVQIKFEYRNRASSGTDDNWNNVIKIFDKNAGLTSINTSIANKGEQGSKVTLDNGIYEINRKVDQQYRYFYVEVNNDMLGLTNYNIEKYLSFRISYKNASTDDFGGKTITNDIIFDRPNKPTISQIKMTSYNTFTITLASFSDTEDIIGDTTSISNNNMGVFLRNINFNVAYKYSDQLSQSNITTFTEIEGGENSATTSTNTSVHINTTSFGSSTYTYTLPDGFYPDGSTNTTPITYYFSASVQNNLISNYSDFSDQKTIEITKPNSSMTITLTPQTSLTSSSNYNNKILATFTAPSIGNRGIVSAQADDGLPKLQKYTFHSTNLKNVDSDVAVEHTNTSNTSNRNADPSTQRMLTFYDSLKGTTGSETKKLDLTVREYNEYVNDHAEVTTNMSATATKPELVTISSHTNLIISNTTSKNTVTLNWNLPDNKRGLTINNVKIRNTILTYRINIERAATTNKYLIDNSNQTDTTYETTTTQSDTSNDKTGTADATNTKTLTSDIDGSLLWPNSTYNYTVRATNSLGYQSDAQTTKGAFTTDPPTIPDAFNYFSDSRLSSLRNNYDLKDNNNYQNLGVLVSAGVSSSTTYSGTAVQITNYNNLSNITSNTVTHVLNKKHLQEFTNTLSNSDVQSWSSSVPTTANQAGFKIVNAADTDTVLYTIGTSTNHATETNDDTVFQVLRTNRKDIYSETYDDRNRGYWLKETIQYKINLATEGNLEAYLRRPLKLELKSYYNTNGSDASISSTQTGETVILQNSYSTNPNDNLYLDVLNSNPSIVKNSTNNMITYTPSNQINGVPNLARGGTIVLKYKLSDYSEHYLLKSSVNVAEHYFSYATSSADSVISWASNSGGTRNRNHWIVNKTLSSIPSTNTAYSGITIKIRARNTKGTSDLTIGSSHSAVYNFIYDKPSSVVFTSVESSLQNIPSNFDPTYGSTSAQSSFTNSSYSAKGSTLNNKQLSLWNGYFYGSQGWQNATSITTSNCTNYGMSSNLPVFSTGSDYKWVIFKYQGSGNSTSAYTYYTVIVKFSDSDFDYDNNIVDEDIVVYFYNRGEPTQGNDTENYYWLNISGKSDYGKADASTAAINTYSGTVGISTQNANSSNFESSSYSKLGTSGARILGGWLNSSSIPANTSANFYLAVGIKNTTTSGNNHVKIKKPEITLAQESVVRQILT